MLIGTVLPVAPMAFASCAALTGFGNTANTSITCSAVRLIRSNARETLDGESARAASRSKSGGIGCNKSGRSCNNFITASSANSRSEPTKAARASIS